MQRTPPTSSHSKCASNPDLSKTDSTSTSDKDCYVNLRKRKQPEMEIIDSVANVVEQKINENLSVWKTKLDSSIPEVIKCALNSVLESEMNKLTSSINDSLKMITGRLDDIEKSLTFSGERQDAFDSRLKSMEGWICRADGMPNQIATLEYKIEQMEQQARQSNIEIVNMPERKDENLIDLVQQIGVIIGHPILPANILSVHRVPHYDKNNPHPKNVIVKFSSKILRDNIIIAARVKKGIDSLQLEITGTQNKIYLNEHLTPKNKQLFRSCREVAKKFGYKHVWVHHGRILVRQTDDSNVLAIRDFQDVNKIKP